MGIIIIVSHNTKVNVSVVKIILKRKKKREEFFLSMKLSAIDTSEIMFFFIRFHQIRFLQKTMRNVVVLAATHFKIGNLRNSQSEQYLLAN